MKGEKQKSDEREKYKHIGELAGTSKRCWLHSNAHRNKAPKLTAFVEILLQFLLVLPSPPQIVLSFCLFLGEESLGKVEIRPEISPTRRCRCAVATHRCRGVGQSACPPRACCLLLVAESRVRFVVAFSSMVAFLSF